MLHHQWQPISNFQSVCVACCVPHHHVDSYSGGWQHEAASRVEQQFRDQVLFERLPAQARASMRSQVGPGAGIALSVVPTGCLTQIPPHLARACGTSVQSIRFATTVLRVQGLECWAEGSSLSKVLHLVFEGRAGGSTNCLMRDLDPPVFATNNRRWEVVLWKLEGAGLPKVRWPSKPRQNLARKHHSFGNVQDKHGGCVGQEFLVAAAKAVATSLLELKVVRGGPSCSVVLADHLAFFATN